MAYEKDLQRVEDAVEALGRIFGSNGPARIRAARSGVALGRTAQRLLWFILTEGPLRVSDLARVAGTTDPIASRQIARLEEAGFVERAPSHDDGRVVVVRATTAGRRAAKRLRQATDEIFREQMQGWSGSDLAALAGLVERLASDLRRAPAPSGDRK